MQKRKIFLCLIIISFLAIPVLITWAWTMPSGNPPSGNISSPIDTSGTAQTKSGNLTIEGVLRVGRFSSAPTGATGSLYFDTGANKLKVYDNAGWTDISGSGSGLTGSGAVGQVSFWTATSTLSGDNGLYWDNTNKRLGIGTTAPGAPLHINNTAAYHAITQGAASMNYYDTAKYWEFLNPGGQLRLSQTWDSNKELVFTADSTSSTYASISAGPIFTSGLRLIANSATLTIGGTSGNVGIGTTGPKGRLDVAGGISVGSYAGVNVPPSNGMIVSGNVGIATTTPASLLTVGSGGQFQVNSSGDIVKLKNLTYAWPTSHTANGYLRNDGSGNLTWETVSSGGTEHNLLSATHLDTLTGSPVLGDLIYANGTPKWTKLTGNTTATKKFLTQTGNGTISAAPLWDTLLASDLPSHSHSAADITAGTLTVARGGTGATTFTANGILYGNGTSAISATAAPTGTYKVLSTLNGTTIGWNDLESSHIPNLDASKIASGNLGIARMPTGGNWDIASDLTIESPTLFVGQASGSYAGNVGIGTTTPAVNLVVNKSGATSRVRINSDSSKSAMLELASAGTPVWHLEKYIDDTFRIVESGADARLTIIQGGQVGIGGPAVPQYALQVTGSINATDSLCINGDCKTSWPTGGGGGLPIGAIILGSSPNDQNLINAGCFPTGQTITTDQMMILYLYQC